MLVQCIRKPSGHAGGNTGQSWGRLPSLGFASLEIQTPKPKKIYKWEKEKKELKPNKKTKEDERKQS